MKPVSVHIDVPQEIGVVYDYLDVMANHEAFTNHYMTGWSFDGPDRGIGSKAHVTAKLGGQSTEVEVEVVDAEAPRKIVEHNVSAGGARLGQGTYVLEALPDGGTRVEFEYAWRQAPLTDRMAGPLVRSMMRKANEKAMQRLAGELSSVAAA
jgi:carbon monoxide dehydrogenase subunit G